MKKQLANLVHDAVRADRAAERMQVAHTDQGGFTTWNKKKVTSIEAPLVGGAYARTIRLHEILHANHSPLRRSKKYHPVTVQAVEDARVHALYWPESLPLKAHRDCLAAALIDARSLRRADLADPDQWNAACQVAVRSLAVVRRLRGFGAERLLHRELAHLPPIVRETLVKCLDNVRNRSRASGIFEALMRSAAEGGKGGAGTGEASESPMRIVRLPLVAPSNSAVSRVQLARSGAHINRARLARAIVNCSPVGLFKRRRRSEGGTILLDASGSMGVCEERLAAICAALPLATVAYYAGRGGMSPDGSYGQLSIYAERGLRAAEAPLCGGNNDVDLYALRWLLEQPAPRVIVTDAEFCGGPAGQDVAASKLLAAEVAAGRVRWIRSYGELADAL